MSSPEEYPRSVNGWLSEISKNGVSERPFAVDSSDLIEPAGYPDQLDTKPERAALAAILSVQAYQKAKKTINNFRGKIEGQSVNLIDKISIDQGFKLKMLSEKSTLVGELFKVSMADGILKDELYLRTLPPDHPAASAYHRLESILEPHRKAILTMSNIPSETANEQQQKQSLVFIDILGGLDALPTAVNGLLSSTTAFYFRQHGKLPNMQETLEIMRASYDTYIEPMASVHKADTFMVKSQEQEIARRGESIAELQDGKIQFTKQTLRLIRQSDKSNRSRTTRCAFLADTKNMQQFLDQPPDFTNPLRDAFDLHMDILSS